MDVLLCTADAIGEGEMKHFDLNGTEVLVCRVGGLLHATSGICPHRGAQLGAGTLDGTVVTCPWHDWEFDVQSGCGLTNPVSNIATYTVTEANGQIILSLPEG